MQSGYVSLSKYCLYEIRDLSLCTDCPFMYKKPLKLGDLEQNCQCLSQFLNWLVWSGGSHLEFLHVVTVR
jgi:hypothetical protein